MRKRKADPEITQSEIEAMEAAEKKAKPFVDKATLDAYNEYLKDWRWRMSTFAVLQREYMGRSGYIRNDNLF